MHNLRQHIYDCIVGAREPLDERVIRIIAGNIAFLVRYTFGPDIELGTISIPIIDIREGHVLKAKQATVVVHEGAGKFTVIVKAQVTGEANVMPVLTEKVDAIINGILETEGSEGYSVQRSH